MSTVEERVRDGFAKAFGGAHDLVAHAPGRVNLIGEHTDYNDGFALPVAVAAETRVALRLRPDDIIRAVALDFDNEADSFDIGTRLVRTGTWRDYLRGVVSELIRSGYVLGGADIAIAGNIPKGAGLSSSASLEIALIRAFYGATGQPFEPVAAALIGQAAENNFVGVKCGNLDQLAVAGAGPRSALLIDCRSLTLTNVALPPNCAIVVVQSGVKRGLVDAAYNSRRAECEQAARAIGVAALRDANLQMLKSAALAMTEVSFRRARHVITENARVVAAVAALKAADYASLGRLLCESHASMRDDFEITVETTDQIAAEMNEICDGIGGGRQTGGGFGGALVAVTTRDTASRLAIELPRRCSSVTRGMITFLPAPLARSAALPF